MVDERAPVGKRKTYGKFLQNPISSNSKKVLTTIMNYYSVIGDKGLVAASLKQTGSTLIAGGNDTGSLMGPEAPLAPPKTQQGDRRHGGQYFPREAFGLLHARPKRLPQCLVGRHTVARSQEEAQRTRSTRTKKQTETEKLAATSCLREMISLTTDAIIH